ncbi:hypothetical protein [Rubripirellula reticaptiva]|uniref:Uncharacterized protein n=1 Tax=Rubripirellula reticaptiva TaxID=2528013 RepID=A0A5C6ESY2_9BACT|nr:hypothetical protein [Rubripirellula reticaptiva]TWU51474.1 hypothetical protein Poly59_30660 [Rubripirellula reticaptiva]
METPNLVRQRIATSHLVGQSIVTEQALRGMVEQLRNSERKPVVMVEHDILCPPLGHTLSGEVTELDDGFHALDVVAEIYGPPQPSALPDGEDGYVVASTTHQNPLSIGIHQHESDENVIRIDPVNFGSLEEADRFFDKLRADGCDGFTRGHSERRSELPDPQVVFDLGLNASVVWIGYRIAKAAADALDPTLKTFFQSMYAAIRRSASEMLPRNRPVTFVLNVNGKPNLQFVARTRDAEAVVNAFESETLSDLKSTIDTALDRFDAEMVQFVLSESGNWVLNYMVSTTGRSIGSKRAFKVRSARIAELDGLPDVSEDRAEPDDARESPS